MKKYFSKFVFALIAFALMAVEGKSQNNVGIGTNTPDPWSLVDMVSTSTGLLIPRLDSNTRKAIPLNVIRRSLLVYDTDYGCFFYIDNAGAAWVSLCNALGPVGPTGATGPTGPTGPSGATGATADACNIAADLTLGSAGVTSGLVSVADSCGVITGTNAAWITTGNFNTTAGTNYLGTNDNADLVFKTNGSAATNERMRMLASGQVVVNKTTQHPSSVFSSFSTTGLNNTLGDTAIAGYASGSRTGVLGITTTGNGLVGRSTIGTGLYAISSQGGLGVHAVSTAGGTGVYGVNSGNGTAIDAENTGTGTALRATATSGANSLAIFAQSNSTGFSSIWAVQNGNANGIGVAGEGGGLGITWHLGVSTGGVFNGRRYGVYGYSYGGTAVQRTAGGFFRDSITTGFDYNAYVATYDGVTNHKIMGTGVVSTIVKDTKEAEVIMYAPEAPEVLFEDYGSGKLVNGQAYITLDPTFAKNVTINEKHPLRVYVQLEGECKGVYVTEKTPNGFLVKELNGGNSNVEFSYHVVANRADETYNGVVVSKYADLRFAKFEGFPKNAGSVNSKDYSKTSTANRATNSIFQQR